MNFKKRTTELPEVPNMRSEQVIGCAVETHNYLGSGLLERIYEEALCYEFMHSTIQYVQQGALPVVYQSSILNGQRIDLVVENTIVLFLKAVEVVVPVRFAQLVTYLSIARLPLGNLINFHVPVFYEGMYRRIDLPALTTKQHAAFSANPLQPLR